MNSISTTKGWREKFGKDEFIPSWKNKLFRFVPCDSPLCYQAKDYIRTTTRSKVGLMGRLKLLITGKLEFEICVATKDTCEVLGTNSVIRIGRFSNVRYVKMRDQ